MFSLTTRIVIAISGLILSTAAFATLAAEPADDRGPDRLKKSIWAKSMLKDEIADRTRSLLEEAVKARGSGSRALLPTFFPIVSGDKLIYRSYRCVCAVNINAGEVIWESIRMLGSLDALARDYGVVRDVKRWLKMCAQQDSRGILLFENSVVGAVSADDKHVFAIDDLAVPPEPGTKKELPESFYRSRLVAFDLTTGRIDWERGDPLFDKSELADSYFLNPPLVIDGKLYTLTEKAGAIRLVCLGAEDGKLLWSEKLHAARKQLLAEPGRRIATAPLSYADGLLVCPTNDGVLFGFDLGARKIRWTYRYRPNGATRLFSDWTPAAAVLAAGRVVFTCPDGVAVNCLSQRDGSLAWQVDRHDDRYLAGVYDDRVVLVGERHCRALNLKDGKELWRAETGQPSGRGVANGGVYYLPVAISAATGKPEVLTLDIATGRILAHLPANEGETLGNLLIHANLLISQNATDVTASPLPGQESANSSSKPNR